jgi:hypothetical protein
VLADKLPLTLSSLRLENYVCRTLKTAQRVSLDHSKLDKILSISQGLYLCIDFGLKVVVGQIKLLNDPDLAKMKEMNRFFFLI